MTPFTALAADFLGYGNDLSEREKLALSELRAYLETSVQPIVNDYWERAEFPHAIVKPLAELGVFSFGRSFTSFENSALFRGLVTLELARIDASVATFNGVTNGLAAGSIDILGSEEQKARWLPGLASGDIVGSFGLTEPESGSDAARGLRTTAEHRGDTWVLNGAKRWIGNATWADIVIVWARDISDDKVKGFVVPTSTPGFSATKIEGKYSLRIVQNADITLNNVVIPDSHHLVHANSFADTNRVLQATRLDVAWSAVGNALGAYEKTVAYAQSRQQFGKPIASFQLVQELLVQALSSITSSLAVVARVSALNEQGIHDDVQSSMAKRVAASEARKVVAWCREILGGNGIVLSHDVIRHFADAESIYSYEGTDQVNALIIGRHITGIQAFV